MYNLKESSDVEKKGLLLSLFHFQQPRNARGRGGRVMHPDASLSPIPDVPSGDERSDHDTPKRGREGAKVSAFNAKFAIGSQCAHCSNSLMKAGGILLLSKVLSEYFRDGDKIPKI